MIIGPQGTGTSGVLASWDIGMAHIDMMTAVDDALAHVDMLSAMDDAMAHVDMLSAIDDAFDFINKKEAESHSSTTLTAVTASCGALLAIGAGFVIKNKFNAVQVGDEKESLL